jgi:hypothetical protein
LPVLAKKLLVALIATVLGLLLLELGAWVVYSAYRHRPFDREEVSARLFGRSPSEPAAAPEADQEEPLRANLPTMIHPYFGYVFNTTWPNINQYGFFGSGPFATRSRDTVIVGLFGGSVAEHMVKQSRDLLLETLQKHAAFKDKRIELFSLAVHAYKQPQQLLILTTLLALGAQFDIVVNLDGFNEIDAAKDNLQDGINPFYPHMWNLYAGRSLASGAAVHIGNAQAVYARREALRGWFASWPVEHSVFLLTVWDFLDQRYVAELRAETLALEQALAQVATAPQVSGPPSTFPDDETMYQEFTEVWARSSLEMAILCRGMGITYFHFLQPNQYLPGSKTLTEEELQDDYDPRVAETGRIATAYPMLIARGRELAEQGVNFVDLTMMFKDERRTVYSDTCCHLNALGNMLLASEIGRAIDEHNAK